MKQLIPDWAMPDAIALVWPEHLMAGTGKLKNFYKEFISKILENKSVIVITSSTDDEDIVKGIFSSSKKVTPVTIPEISDIWIRDFGPLFITINGTNIPVFFNYKPSYFHSKHDKEVMWRNKMAGEELAKKLGYDNFLKIKVDCNDLNLDGGNIIHNGAGTTIITNKLIVYNETLLIDDINDAIKQELGISKLIMIPSEPQDDTGHIDGAVRFLNEDTVVVTRYTNDVELESRIWSETVARHLQSEGLSVERITNENPRHGRWEYKKVDGTTGEFENAWGNYLNFLRFGNYIYMPAYKDSQSLNNDAISTIKRILNLDPVPINIPEELAGYGGLLNCITLPVFYNNRK